MPRSVGEAAPDFSLYDTNKKLITLSSFHGKRVVLLFFPFAFSSVCTKEMCEMESVYADYEELDAEIIAVSVDSLYTHKKFKEIYNLRFTLLSDFNKEVSALYDVLDTNFAFGYRGVSRRASFVIDPAGIIAFAEVLPSPGDYPDMTRLKQTVMNLR